MAEIEILKAVEVINRKIATLQEARSRLVEAFGITSSVPNTMVEYAASLTTPHAQTSTVGKLPKGRKSELARFLAEHGPMSRADIVTRAGMPEGTISYCLSDKRFFIQLENGDWGATEFSKNGLRKSGVLETQAPGNEIPPENDPLVSNSTRL